MSEGGWLNKGPVAIAAKVEWIFVSACVEFNVARVDEWDVSGFGGAPEQPPDFALPPTATHRAFSPCPCAWSFTTLAAISRCSNPRWCFGAFPLDATKNDREQQWEPTPHQRREERAYMDMLQQGALAIYFIHHSMSATPQAYSLPTQAQPVSSPSPLSTPPSTLPYWQA